MKNKHYLCTTLSINLEVYLRGVGMPLFFMNLFVNSDLFINLAMLFVHHIRITDKNI